MADTAAGADLADDGQNDVLRRDPRLQLPVDRDRHGLGTTLRQRLRRQHMLHFAGADAEGQRAERAVGRGVAVAADDRHPRQRQTLLGTDDVDDPLPGIG